MKTIERILEESEDLFRKAEEPLAGSVNDPFRLIFYNDTRGGVHRITGSDKVKLAACAFMMRGMLRDANILMAQYSFVPMVGGIELLEQTASNSYAMLAHRYASRVAGESDQERFEHETKALIQDSNIVKRLTGISPDQQAYVHVLATLSALSSSTLIGIAAVQYLRFVFGSSRTYGGNVVQISTAFARLDPGFEPTIQKLFRAVVTRDLGPSRRFVGQIQRLTGVSPVIEGRILTVDQYVEKTRELKGVKPRADQYIARRGSGS